MQERLHFGLFVSVLGWVQGKHVHVLRERFD